MDALSYGLGQLYTIPLLWQAGSLIGCSQQIPDLFLQIACMPHRWEIRILVPGNVPAPERVFCG